MPTYSIPSPPRGVLLPPGSYFLFVFLFFFLFLLFQIDVFLEQTLSLRASILAVKEEHREATRQVTTLQSENAELLLVLDDKEAKLEDLDEQLSLTRDQLHDRQGELADMDAELLNAQDRMEREISEKNHLRREVEALREYKRLRGADIKEGDCPLCLSEEPGLECTRGHPLCFECINRSLRLDDSLRSINTKSYRCSSCPTTEHGFQLQDIIKGAGMLLAPLPDDAPVGTARTGDVLAVVIFKLIHAAGEKEANALAGVTQQRERKDPEASTLTDLRFLLSKHCPKNQHMFDDYDGCAVVHCAYPGCRCTFCGCCNEDMSHLGDVAQHDHVSNCTKNPTPGTYFVDHAEWKRSQNTIHRDKARAYLGNLSDEFQARISEKVTDLIVQYLGPE